MEKIVVLFPTTFLKSDYDRFGIEFLKKNFSVKILDFTAWICPDLWKEEYSKVYKCKEHIIISCKKDFLAFDSKTDPIIVFDLLKKNRETNWVRKQLKKRNSLFVEFDLALIPQVKEKNIIKLFKRSFNLITDPKNFFYNFFEFFENKYYSLKKTHLPDILVVGGLASPIKLKAKHKIFAHGPDYDVYLNLRNKPINNENPYAVFLDGDMVTHPDILYLRLKALVNEFQYYPVLIKFLKKFEIETGLQIKFAVHPKSRNKNLPNLLKDIDYSIGNTAELVKNSSAVLLHSSTALSYAILFKKPAIFLTSNQLKKSWIGPRIDTFAKVVNGQLINMDNDSIRSWNTQGLLKIDEDKYKNYLDQYVKVPNSQDIPVFEILAQYIKSKQFEK